MTISFIKRNIMEYKEIEGDRRGYRNLSASLSFSPPAPPAPPPPPSSSSRTN
jgi:hypothetical protein